MARPRIGQNPARCGKPKRSATPQNDATGWEIRPLDVVFNQLIDGDVRIVYDSTAGVDHFAQIVRGMLVAIPTAIPPPH